MPTVYTYLYFSERMLFSFCVHPLYQITLILPSCTHAMADWIKVGDPGQSLYGEISTLYEKLLSERDSNDCYVEN